MVLYFTQDVKINFDTFFAGSPSSVSETGVVSTKDVSPDRLSSHTLTTTSELASRHHSPTNMKQYASSVVENLNRMRESPPNRGVFGSPLRTRKGSQPVMSSSQLNGHSPLQLSCRHTSLPGTPTLLSPRDRRKSTTPASKAQFVPLPNVSERMLNGASHKSNVSQHVVTAIVHTDSLDGCVKKNSPKKSPAQQTEHIEMDKMSHNNNEKQSKNIYNKHTYENLKDFNELVLRVHGNIHMVHSDQSLHSSVCKENSKNTSNIGKSQSDTFKQNKTGILIIKDSPKDIEHSKLGMVDRVSPDLGVDTSPTGTMDGDDRCSAGFGSSSTMSMGSDISPTLDKRKLYPFLDKVRLENE